MLNLQLTDAVAVTASNNIFGPGILPFFLYDVDCRGNETKLDECFSNVLVARSCFSYKAAGVICPPGIVVQCTCQSSILARLFTQF